MIELRFDNSFVQLSGKLDPSVTAALGKELSYFQQGAQFTSAFKQGRWDGRVSLLRRDGPQFKAPTGLLSIIALFFRNLNILYTIYDDRIRPRLDGPTFPWKSSLEPRPYQDEAVDSALAATRGIWSIGTGGGKTYVASRFIHEVGLPALVLVNSKEALKDCRDEMREHLGCTVGEWWSGKKEPGYVTVATVQSLFTTRVKGVIRRPNPELWELFQACPVLIVDELHHASSDQWFKIVQSSPAYYKIGQTGTAYRKDGSDIMLQAATGRILYHMPASALQSGGYLQKSKVVFYRTEPPSHMTLSQLVLLDPLAQYRHGIVHNMRRNLQIANLVSEHLDRTLLVTVKLKEHGVLLAGMTGLPFISGDEPSKERDRIRDGLKSGQLKGVIATSLYDESVNFPRLNVCINAAGHSPRNAQAQRHGRILRSDGTGSESLFIDFSDLWLDRTATHSRNRMRYMKQEGHEVIEIAPEEEVSSKIADEELIPV